MTTKMTLSVEPAVAAKARRLSKHRHTSISAMFSNYIASLDENDSPDEVLPPVTKRILEMGKKIPQLPAEWDYRETLADAIADKYGSK